jgi:hypothetical protein
MYGHDTTAKTVKIVVTHAQPNQPILFAKAELRLMVLEYQFFFTLIIVKATTLKLIKAPTTYTRTPHINNMRRTIGLAFLIEVAISLKHKINSKITVSDSLAVYLMRVCLSKCIGSISTSTKHDYSSIN